MTRNAVARWTPQGATKSRRICLERNILLAKLAKALMRKLEIEVSHGSHRSLLVQGMDDIELSSGPGILANSRGSVHFFQDRTRTGQLNFGFVNLNRPPGDADLIVPNPLAALTSK